VEIVLKLVGMIRSRKSNKDDVQYVLTNVITQMPLPEQYKALLLVITKSYTDDYKIDKREAIFIINQLFDAINMEVKVVEQNKKLCIEF
jgi:hypothetical protein